MLQGKRWYISYKVASDKAENRLDFHQYLACQGLSLRRDSIESQSNFDQLMLLQGEQHPEIFSNKLAT